MAGELFTVTMGRSLRYTWETDLLECLCMLNCQEATRLLSESQERDLAFSERMNLKLHLLLCQGCANFGKQMGVLRQLARRYKNAGLPEDDSRLS